jgi:hypothetical protein
VIDEQHRFGVGQRLALREKGERGIDVKHEPHQLMMSATPIPRTLSMSYFADLDVSVIDELPPGRTPIQTKLLAESRRDEVLARIRAACQEGAQAYWVCPLIEESETLQLKTAVETFDALTAALPDVKVGLVHGRMKAAEKNDVMAKFLANEVQLLVATTVIEVGVDVPNASLMVIEHAERMGLAQLHQLRGRVGRGARHSTCILLYQSPLGELARARLKVIYESTDGFEIAREDLRLRGPGEHLGARQSGAPLLRFADIERDVDLLEAARETAAWMLRHEPARAEKHLARWLGSSAVLSEGMRTLRLLRPDAWHGKPPSHGDVRFGRLHPWLTSRGSLTARIVSRFDHFNLVRLTQHAALPNTDERRELGLRDREFAMCARCCCATATRRLCSRTAWWRGAMCATPGAACQSWARGHWRKCCFTIMQ